MDSNESNEAAMNLMKNHAVRRVPVVTADGRLTGLISIDDLVLRADRHKGAAVSAPSRLLYSFSSILAHQLGAGKDVAAYRAIDLCPRCPSSQVELRIECIQPEVIAMRRSGGGHGPPYPVFPKSLRPCRAPEGSVPFGATPSGSSRSVAGRS